MRISFYIAVFVTVCFGIEVYGQPVVDTLVAKRMLIQNEVDVNTANSEFCPTSYFGNLGITYTEQDADGVPNYNIGYLNFSDPDSIALTSFGGDINTDMHEGPFVVDEGDSILYVTRVRTVLHERTQRKRSLRQIVAFDLKSNTPAQVLPINDNLHHVCHPTLSNDGNTMVFSADYDDQGMDLYVVNRINGTWQEPTRLSTSINTSSNEFFPTLYSKDTLFFSSDRTGNIDLYVSTRQVDGWTIAQRLPEPFNSPSDDLGMYIKKGGKQGYVSSNRSGGQGADDIYRWESSESIFYDPERYLKSIKVTAMRKLGFTPVHGAAIQLYPLDLKDENVVLDLIQGTTGDGELLLKLKPASLSPERRVVSDASGEAVVNYHSATTYLAVVSAEGMNDYSFLLRGEMDDVTALLNPAQKKVERKEPVPTPEVRIPTSKGDVVVYENIYYDYNSSNIRDGAAKELDALAEVMKQRPTMVIQLSAHTDSRGPEAYNQQLSEKRALSAKIYLIKKGVEKERVYSVGYGESRLRNHCKNGVQCSEDEHRYNRRTEVLVIEE